MYLKIAVTLAASMLIGQTLAGQDQKASCVGLGEAETSACHERARAWRMYLWWHVWPAEPPWVEATSETFQYRDTVILSLAARLARLGMEVPAEELAPIENRWNKGLELIEIDSDLWPAYHSKLVRGKSAFRNEKD